MRVLPGPSTGANRDRLLSCEAGEDNVRHSCRWCERLREGRLPWFGRAVYFGSNRMLCFEIRARYLDGNAAAGELSNIFTMDVTAAEGHCAHCGATKRFAEAHVYMQAPGLVAPCSVCQHVLLRLVNARERVFLDLHGMRCLILDTSRLLESGR